MLEKLSFNQLKLVRNLKLRKPWKEFLKELIPFNGVSNFLRGRSFIGIISAIIIPILSENMPKKIFNEVLSCLFAALGGDSEELIKTPKMSKLGIFLVAFELVHGTCCMVSAPKSTRSKNYRALKDFIYGVLD